MKGNRIAPWSISIASLVSLTACPDDAPSNPMDDGTTTGPITDTFPPDGSTGTTAVGDGTMGSSTTSVVDDTGDTGELCETLLCDGICCESADMECVNDQCLPPCPTNIRCGENQEVCCEADQVCLAHSCATPTGPCTDSFDCAEGEFCEPTLDQCLPQPEPLDCEVFPEFEIVQPSVEWSFETEEVVTMPAVGDVDGDGRPEVVVNTWNVVDMDGGASVFWGHIWVLDGETGAVQFYLDDDPAADVYGAYGRYTVSIADVDDNGLADIIYAGRPAVSIPGGFPNNSSLMHAVNGLGQLLWTSHAPDGSDYYVYARNGATATANFDSDDASEIVVGSVIIDNDGTVVFDQPGDWIDGTGTNLGGGVMGQSGDYLGGISTVADLTGDGYPEVIAGRRAYTVDWDDAGPGAPNVQLNLLWEHVGPDGFTAVADFDQDGNPEVVLVGDPAPYSDPDGSGPQLHNGQIQILNGATGELWCGVDPTDAMCQVNPSLRTQPIPVRGVDGIPGGGRGGPPTVADFDGDGRPEIAVAGAVRYSVYDINRAGEDVVQPAGDPPPAAGALFVRWTSVTQDASSNTTGSSVFDFQGDGIAEVMYGDECYTRVYDGQDGSVLIEIENSSGTIHEYPIVVDVDADGNSELLVVANDFNWMDICGTIPGYTPHQGVFVYGDASDSWVRTRRVWNTHAYHVTNATSTGLTPTMELNNWEDPNLNNYRQNFQGSGVFNAADLEVSLSIGLANCLQEEFEVIATVRNTGSLGVPAGVDVSLYRGSDASGMLVSTQTTPADLLPGAQVDLSWTEPNPGGMPQDYYVEIDTDSELVIVECVEDNNSDVATSVACPDAG
ncbi:MAG: hypothetical protein H6712_07365 [Myxococcales bacterium]|nr:hypothetical protein [Myxococcales bacterium]MCB9713653.1 hypothetical protein [Myxococcales bacterium]